MKKLSVIIIGAGPAGSLLAYLLCRQGKDVVVLEKNAFPLKDKVCGEYLCPAGCQLLDELGLGHVLENYPPIYGMNIYSPNQQKVDTIFPNKKFGRAISRDKFDNVLIQIAQSSGAKFMFGITAKNFKVENDAIMVSDDHQQWVADYLIGADGRQSTVGKWIGLRRVQNNRRVALHCYLNVRPGVKSSQGEMHIFNDGSYCGLNPVDEKNWNFSIVCNSAKIKNKSTVDIIKETILDSKRLSEIFNVDESKFECKVVGAITNPMEKLGLAQRHSFLVGDAAGFIDPLTGEGIYHAVLTAKHFAQAASRDSSKEEILRIYERNIKWSYRQKEIVNLFFQWLIKQPNLCNLVACFLKSRPQARNAFVGLIGNVYSPGKSLGIIFKSIFTKKEEYLDVNHH